MSENWTREFPDIAAEWHPTKNGNMTPSCISIGSHKKCWFYCKNGHEWQTELRSRTLYKNNCPYCSGQKVCDDNCLATKSPDIAAEWHPTKNGNPGEKQIQFQMVGDKTNPAIKKLIQFLVDNGIIDNTWKARGGKEVSEYLGSKYTHFPDPDMPKTVADVGQLDTVSAAMNKITCSWGLIKSMVLKVALSIV
jgi:Pyruvate/2-oxoacid:ferredoxin oxidoreductase delta subunit